jgi:predicted HTH transcriptional regulator
VTVQSCTAHIASEQQQIMEYISTSHNTVRALMRRSGLGERRIQRRVRELLALGLIEQTGTRTAPGGVVRVFGLTERNVPSTAGGSTVRG